MSDNADYQKKADRMMEEAQKHEAALLDAAEQLEQSCEANANKIRSGIRAATEVALKDARSISNTMDGWGIGVGELTRMPIQQKMELTKRDLRRSSV